MSRKKARKRDQDVDLDSLADWLVARARKKVADSKRVDELRRNILIEAEAVARWKKKPFYVT